jgi:hypothetical protein
VQGVVGPGVAGLAGQLVGLDGPDHLGAAQVRRGVHHVDARGAQAGDDEVAALQRLAVVAVALVTERAGAGIPAEVVQLVAGGRQLRPADHHLAVVGGGRVGVDRRHGVPGLAGRVVGGHVRQPLRWRGDSVGRAAVEGRIRGLGHRRFSPACRYGSVDRPNPRDCLIRIEYCQGRSGDRSWWRTEGAEPWMQPWAPEG